MSAQNDPEMDNLDCSAVIADVWLLLDDECDECSRKRLRQHIDSCGHCFEAYGIEEKVKSLVNRKCGGEKAPDSLRSRLKLEIHRSISVTRSDSSAE